MPARKLKEFLDARNVRYVVITHSPAYTAQEVAASAHVPGRELAKTVVVKLDDKPALAVLPATREIDFDRLRKTIGAKSATLAHEDEFEKLFPGCEVGAIPPFGNLFDMPTYADESLTEDEHIAFSAGTHSELIQLAFDDFKKLAEPTLARLS